MAKEDISSKLMIFRSDRKKNRQNPTIGRKKSYLKGIRGYATMYKEVEVGTLLIGNGKKQCYCRYSIIVKWGKVYATVFSVSTCNYKNTVWWAKIWWLAVITLFCPLSDALRNHHIHFFCACSYTTKLWSPVLLAFQLPFKSRTCYVQEISYSKKLQQLSIRSFRHSVKWKCMDE